MGTVQKVCERNLSLNLISPSTNPFYTSAMTARFMPGKPKVRKVNGIWQVFVPNAVFAQEATGTYHGPCGSWESAVMMAVGISAAVLRNVQAINTDMTQIGSMN
jgi:hypothetical protein